MTKGKVVPVHRIIQTGKWRNKSTHSWPWH